MPNFGFKHSEESKKKIGLKSIGNKYNLGRKLSPEHKQKIVKYLKKGNIGLVHSLETRQKMSKAHKGNKYSLGYKHTKETLEKMRIAHLGLSKGNKCTFWKGGISEKNNLIRSSNEYKIWRVTIFERDKFVCQMPACDHSERYIQAHHIKRFSDYPELRFDINNGITLCRNCHEKTKKREEEFEKLFALIIKK